MTSIDLDIPNKIKSRAYRSLFFRAEASARIAEQLISCRKRRGLTQCQLAELIGTKQPVISRIERADYRHWNLNTIFDIADALDARVSVVIEPWDDIRALTADQLVKK